MNAAFPSARDKETTENFETLLRETQAEKDGIFPDDITEIDEDTLRTVAEKVTRCADAFVDVILANCEEVKEA